ncbi:MAG: Asp-tRNA(Asn)/Glu-tRNA(Gln) amidotransferase subunit GatB [Phycisphaerales bacterium]|nr:Asp-tRNA(Asn)/Glu-tRNA(Gln) amidotransferase subunit GatB [Phycisphaerales bacterium]
MSTHVDQKSTLLSHDNNILYDTVIGLEIHAQLKTNTKLFSGDILAFASEPNTAISPIVLGYPGTLPQLNKATIELALKIGLGCHATIPSVSYFERKHYFYPDLPKGYQITQNKYPIIQGGWIDIKTPTGLKKIELDHIHLEEDAGKAIHDLDPQHSYIDFNRAGAPLLEMVTKPCLSSELEVANFISAYQKLLRWLSVSDADLEKGMLRCDVNISVKRTTTEQLGTRVELKNLNSIRNIKKAISVERQRMIDILKQGGVIEQETRGFDAQKDMTFSLREKELAHDYCYFPEPDIPPVQITNAWVEQVAKQLPTLPEQRQLYYTHTLLLTDYQAELLCDNQSIGNYFEIAIQYTKHHQPLANWMIGPIKEWLNQHKIDSFEECPVAPHILANLINLEESKKITHDVAIKHILPLLLNSTAESPTQIAERLNLFQENNEEELEQWVRDVLATMPDKVAEFKKGKLGLIGLFVGAVKKKSNGKADPQKIVQIVEQVLSSTK